MLTELHDIVVSENLTLSKVNRSDMGVYLCLARSPVPPIMSKRFSVRVNCKLILLIIIIEGENAVCMIFSFPVKPQVQVENHYVGAPITKDVKLHCKIEASPRATFQWINSRSKFDEKLMCNYVIFIGVS